MQSAPRTFLRNLCLFFGIVAGSLSHAQQPQVLIAQPCQADGYPKLNLMDPIAEQMDEIGVLAPVTYSMLDQVYRKAVLDGKIPPPPKQPTPAQALLAAKTLNIPYVIWIEEREVRLEGPKEGSGPRLGNGVGAKLTLFKNGKQIWKDDMAQSVSVGTVDLIDQTVKSLASSLCAKMRDQALRGLPAAPKVKTTAGSIGAGQAPIIPEGGESDPVLNDWVAIQQQVKELVGLRKFTQAEMLLRDSVDAAPLAIDRRKALISFLRDRGDNKGALKAITEATIAIGPNDLAAVGVQMLLLEGRRDEAQAILNDALASGATDPDLLVVAAELRMRQAKPDQAIKYLDQAIKAKETAATMGLRSLCRAMMGGLDGSQADLKQAVKLDGTIVFREFPKYLSIFDEAMRVQGPDIRTLFQKLILKPNSDEVAEELDAQERAAEALEAFLGEEAANPRFSKSHGLRVLALSLLLQTIGELREYIKSGQETALNEARIDFGEALKHLSAAEKEFANENQNAGNLEAHCRVLRGVRELIFADQTDFEEAPARRRGSDAKAQCAGSV